MTAVVRAGLLRHRLTFQTATETRDAQGGVTKTWVDTVTVWGDVAPIRAREYLNADQIRADITHQVIIRQYPGLTTKQRMKWTDDGTDRYFHIESIIDMEERDRKLQIFCKEEV